MFLVCCVICHNHKIILSCAFMGGIPSWYVTNLTSLVAIGTAVVEIPCDQRVSKIMGGSPSRLVTILSGLVTISTVVV